MCSYFSNCPCSTSVSSLHKSAHTVQVAITRAGKFSFMLSKATLKHQEHYNIFYHFEWNEKESRNELWCFSWLLGWGYVIGLLVQAKKKKINLSSNHCTVRAEVGLMVTDSTRWLFFILIIFCGKVLNTFKCHLYQHSIYTGSSSSHHESKVRFHLWNDALK